MEMLNTSDHGSVEIITMENETTTAGNTFLQQMEQLITYKMAIAIAKYWFKCLAPFGLIGNTLSFLVMMKPSNRKMSTCIYMASISVNDNVMMLLAIYVHLTNDINVHEMGNFECKFFAYLALFCLQNTTYQVLAMTTDKFIAIKWPHKAATYSTPRRAKIALLCVHIFVIVYNIPHFFLSDKEANLCRVYINPSLFSSIHSWLSFVVNFIIPFSLLFFMNLVIIQEVKRSHQKFGKMPNLTEETSDDNPAQLRLRGRKSVENQLTRMLVTITSFFLLLLVPTYVRFVYTTLVVPDTPERQAESILMYHLSSKLYFTNSGVNFFLYCISGQKFRSDLKELLCFCSYMVPGRRKSEASGTTLSTIEGESNSKTVGFATTQNAVWKVVAFNVQGVGTCVSVCANKCDCGILTSAWRHSDISLENHHPTTRWFCDISKESSHKESSVKSVVDLLKLKWKHGAKVVWWRK